MMGHMHISCCWCSHIYSELMMIGENDQHTEISRWCDIHLTDLTRSLEEQEQYQRRIELIISKQELETAMPTMLICGHRSCHISRSV